MGKLERGENELIQNIEQDSTSQSSKEALKTVGVSSSMFIPFRDLTGKLIGSVGLDLFNGIIELTPEQIQIASLINAQIVTQLQNLRLLENSQSLAEQLGQIARYSETVQSRFDLSEILQTTLHFAKRMFELEYFGIVLYDERAEKLLLQAYCLHETEMVINDDAPTLSPNESIVGQVWKKREAIYVNDVSDSTYTHPIIDEGITTIYAVALISRGVTRGVIEMGKSQHHAIRRTEQDVFRQLANQLAVALENAITYSQNQQLTQNKILANEISLQLQQQMDIDSLLNTTITELGKALGAKRARIRLGVQQQVVKKP